MPALACAGRALTHLRLKPWRPRVYPRNAMGASPQGPGHYWLNQDVEIGASWDIQSAHCRWLRTSSCVCRGACSSGCGSWPCTVCPPSSANAGDVSWQLPSGTAANGKRGWGLVEALSQLLLFCPVYLCWFHAGVCKDRSVFIEKITQQMLTLPYLPYFSLFSVPWGDPSPRPHAVSHPETHKPCCPCSGQLHCPAVSAVRMHHTDLVWRMSICCTHLHTWSGRFLLGTSLSVHGLLTFPPSSVAPVPESRAEP
jgi:hypothetical protein